MYQTKKQLLDEINRLIVHAKSQEMKIAELNRKLDCKNRDTLTQGLDNLPVCTRLFCSYCKNSIRVDDEEGGWIRLCIKDVPCNGFILSERK